MVHTESQEILHPKQDLGGRPGKPDEAITWPQGGKTAFKI